ncbi:hypothetical protein PAPYR_11032 [Paratrimastix pyriformis]|uniref:Uncharacterized protein n=1 Tax=Paratrimastix pyriformis TaxID=342808 RepID=A0ABQ8U4N3_9EUKA|nr:hypothetical protein PAPYR_11032 [Paratrimastix pyriformis]
MSGPSTAAAAAAPYRPLSKLSKHEKMLQSLSDPKWTEPVRRGPGGAKPKPTAEEAWTHFETAARSYFLTDWRGRPDEQIASRNNVAKYVISYSKALARKYRKAPKTPRYRMNDAEKERVKRVYHEAKAAAIAKYGDPMRLEPKSEARKDLMKQVNKDALSAVAAVSAVIRRESGKQAGFGVRTYPDMGPNFYRDMPPTVLTEEEQAQIAEARDRAWENRIHM